MCPLQYTSICGSPRVCVIILILWQLYKFTTCILITQTGNLLMCPLQYTSICGSPRVCVITLILWQLYKFTTCILITQTGNLLRSPFTIPFHIWVTKGKCYYAHFLDNCINLLPVSGLHKLAIFSGAPLQYTSIYGSPRVRVITLILWQLYRLITCLRITQTGNLLRRPFTIYFHIWVTKGARNNAHSLHARGKGELTHNANFKVLLKY